MSARDELDLFHAAVADDPRRPAALLDAYRAEVLAEAADRMAELLQDTPEYGPWVASKVREMATAEAGESRA